MSRFVKKGVVKDFRKECNNVCIALRVPDTYKVFWEFGEAYKRMLLLLLLSLDFLLLAGRF